MTTQIEAALAELIPSENAINQSFGRLIFLQSIGMDTPALRASYEQQRSMVALLEQGLYSILTAALEPFGLASRVPRPADLPRLPDAGATQTLNTRGLGAAPLIVWGVIAAAAIIQIAIVAAAAWAVVSGIQIGADLVRAIVAARENTKRYNLELSATESRFNACLRAGGDFASCAAQVPVPTPVYEQPPEARTDPAVAGVAVAAGVATLCVFGYIGFKLWQKNKVSGAFSTASHAFASTRGTARMSSSDIARELVDGALPSFGPLGGRRSSRSRNPQKKTRKRKRTPGVN